VLLKFEAAHNRSVTNSPDDVATFIWIARQALKQNGLDDGFLSDEQLR
jgi:hypothetical protein